MFATGLLENAKLIKTIYPYWTLWIYVPEESHPLALDPEVIKNATDLGKLLRYPNIQLNSNKLAKF